MTVETRENETAGSLDARVFALEQSSLNRWEKWFDKSPGTVLAATVSALVAAFWIFYTYQINRLEQNHKDQISTIILDNATKVKWLNEQHEIAKKNQTEQCSIQVSRLKANAEKCQTDLEKLPK